MKLVYRKDIDPVKWNKRIAKDTIENIFCYTWYLDSVSENWAAIISDDNYDTILPIPFTTKLGVKQFYPAPFTREYDIFGTSFSWAEALPFIQNEFNKLIFRNRIDGLLNNSTTRKNQELLLNKEFEQNYRSNAKRLVKKGNKNYKFENSNNVEVVIKLFKETVAHKVNSIKTGDLDALTILMHEALSLNKGELLIAKNDKETIVAGGFFLKDKQRIIYLKGAALEQDKKQGVMYALIDNAAKKFATTYPLLDFGGSDIDGVATFYKKFGAVDREYYHYELDRSPIWFKALKKIVRK